MAIREGLPDILSKRRYRNRLTFASMVAEAKNGPILEEKRKTTIAQKSMNKISGKYKPIEV